MKTITLTMNEALVLIAEGMTMNNVKTLANKLRNADAPVATLSTEKYDLEKAKAQSKTWEHSYHDAMVNLDKAKQTETKLRKVLAEEGERLSRLTSKIRDLENDAKQDAESLKYFRKWVADLRTLLECDEGLTSAVIMSEAIEHIKNHNQTVEALNKGTLHLIKANDVIAAVKLVYDADDFNDDKISLIISVVEAYYRGN